MNEGRGSWLKNFVKSNYGEKAHAELCWKIERLPETKISDLGDPVPFDLSSSEFEFVR